MWQLVGVIIDAPFNSATHQILIPLYLKKKKDLYSKAVHSAFTRN